MRAPRGRYDILSASPDMWALFATNNGVEVGDHRDVEIYAAWLEVGRIYQCDVVVVHYPIRERWRRGAVIWRVPGLSCLEP